MNKDTLGFFFISGILLFLCLHARASEFVQYPLGPAEWTVTTSDSPNSKSPQKRGGSAIEKVEVKQNDELSSNLVTYFNGKSRVSWNIVGTNLIITEDPNGTAFLTPSSIFFNIPYLPSIFDWLSPKFLVEKSPIDYGGKLCFHYKGPVGEAWIESKTLLPVALDDGQTLATFDFGPPPSTPLVMPEKFRKVLDGYTAVMGIRRPK